MSSNLKYTEPAVKEALWIISKRVFTWGAIIGAMYVPTICIAGALWIFPHTIDFIIALFTRYSTEGRVIFIALLVFLGLLFFTANYLLVDFVADAADEFDPNYREMQAALSVLRQIVSGWKLQLQWHMEQLIRNIQQISNNQAATQWNRLADIEQETKRIQRELSKLFQQASTQAVADL